MSKIAIIGADSYIASNFVSTNNTDWTQVLISRIATGRKQEIVQESLFELDENVFKACECAINFTAIVHQPKLKMLNAIEK